MDFVENDGKVSIAEKSIEVIIKDFQKKMRCAKVGEYLRTKTMRVNGVELYFRVYPNGERQEDKGWVSVFISNASQEKIFLNYKIQMDGQTLERREESQPINPKQSRGISNLYCHSQNKKTDNELKIVFKIMKRAKDPERKLDCQDEDQEVLILSYLQYF